ncbi:unnamed protein product, partial [Laminaria digitata]
RGGDFDEFDERAIRDFQSWVATGLAPEAATVAQHNFEKDKSMLRYTRQVHHFLQVRDGGGNAPHPSRASPGTGGGAAVTDATATDAAIAANAAAVAALQGGNSSSQPGGFVDNISDSYGNSAPPAWGGSDPLAPNLVNSIASTQRGVLGGIGMAVQDGAFTDGGHIEEERWGQTS